MMKIPDRIRCYVLREYIKRCNFLHSIAYFEWRSERTPGKAKDLEEMLNYRKFKLAKEVEQFSKYVTEYKETELGIS
jgi:hypothetical protein